MLFTSSPLVPRWKDLPNGPDEETCVGTGMIQPPLPLLCDDGVAVGVGIWVDVGIGVTMEVGVAVTTGACVGVGEGVTVAVGVGEGVTVGVGVPVGVGVAVTIGVGVGVTFTRKSSTDQPSTPVS